MYSPLPDCTSERGPFRWDTPNTESVMKAESEKFFSDRASQKSDPDSDVESVVYLEESEVDDEDLYVYRARML